MKRTTWRRLFPVSRLAGETSGAEIAEAAVVLPLLFMLLFGIMWFARAFNIYTTVNRAAREGALALSVPTTSASLGNTFAQQQSDVDNVVNPILSASHLDPAQATATVTVLSNVPLAPGSPVSGNKVVVTVTYPYNFRLNGITCCPPSLSPITTGIVIKGQAQARQED